MINSKALKDFSSEKSSKIYSWWIESAIGKAYYKVEWFFQKPYYQLKKLIQWQWNVFRFDYDFDGHCMFAIIEYKLKRILPVLERGHAIQEDQDMHALRLAIKLAGRLKDDKYDIIQHDRHAKKWGESKYWFTPTGDGTGSSYMHSSRPNANTPEEKEQERKDFLAGCYASDAQMKREEKWLYAILHKYMRRWWD